MDQNSVGELARRVGRLKEEALELSRQGKAFPAVWRNSERILACVRMLEMDLGLAEPEGPPPSAG